MSVHLHSVWPSRFVTFALAALLAASAVYWVLRWPQPAVQAPVAAAPPQSASVDAQALAGLLGHSAVPAAAAPAGRYLLTGVLAGPGRGGAALISIDGKPAKPFRVGTLVADNLYLQTVAGRRAVLAAGSVDGAASLTLEMKPVSR